MRYCNAVRELPALPDAEANDPPEEAGILLVVADAVLAIQERRLVVEEVMRAHGEACPLGGIKAVEMEVIADSRVDGRP